TRTPMTPPQRGGEALPGVPGPYARRPPHHAPP
ncbi:hypothetical protein AWZ03_014766, partial [Drosophila navojoa]